MVLALLVCCMRDVDLRYLDSWTQAESQSPRPRFCASPSAQGFRHCWVAQVPPASWLWLRFAFSLKAYVVAVAGLGSAGPGGSSTHEI